ncbi:hypothetical protein VP01_5320g1, partial [Puccinia sorghi]
VILGVESIGTKILSEFPAENQQSNKKKHPLNPRQSQITPIRQSQITPINYKKKGKKSAKNQPTWFSIKLIIKMPKSNINVKGGIQMLKISRTSFLNHIGYILISLPDNEQPNTYKCLWCKKEVRVSGIILSNLWTHHYGSRQTARVSYGCPQGQKSIEKDAKLPSFHLLKKCHLSFTRPIFLEIIFEFQRTVKDHMKNVIIHAQGIMFCLKMIITHNSCGDHFMTLILFFYVLITLRDHFMTLIFSFLCYYHIENVDLHQQAQSILKTPITEASQNQHNSPKKYKFAWISTNLMWRLDLSKTHPQPHSLDLGKPKKYPLQANPLFSCLKYEPILLPLLPKPRGNPSSHSWKLFTITYHKVSARNEEKWKEELS